MWYQSIAISVFIFTVLLYIVRYEIRMTWSFYEVRARILMACLLATLFMASVIAIKLFVLS